MRDRCLWITLTSHILPLSTLKTKMLKHLFWLKQSMERLYTSYASRKAIYHWHMKNYIIHLKVEYLLSSSIPQSCHRHFFFVLVLFIYNVHSFISPFLHCGTFNSGNVCSSTWKNKEIKQVKLVCPLIQIF